MTEQAFRHFASPIRVHYGNGSAGELAGEVERAGCRRVVVFCGSTLSRSDPGLASVREALGDRYVGAFKEVDAQSPVPSVEAAAHLLSEYAADGVVALGGGSAIVTARAASILAAEGGAIEALATTFEKGRPPRSPRLAKPKPKQFIIPTTPTTAYAKAGAAAAVPGEGRRLALFDPKARAHAIFFDPDYFMPTPDALFRDAALDAFALGIQGLESDRRNPLADAALLQGVRLIHRHIADHGRSDKGAAARGAIMLAALLIGDGTDHTGSGLASALGHMVGARYGLANGVVKSVMLPHTIGFNARVTADRLTDVAAAIGLDPATSGTAPAIAKALQGLFASLGLPSRLRDLAIPTDEIALVAREAADDFFYFQNPRRVEEGELIEMLTAAW